MSRFATVALLSALCISAAGAADDAVIERLIQAADDAQRAGEDAKAEALLVGVVAETEKLSGQGTRRASAIERLADFYSNRGRHDEARPLLRHALEVREKAQGKDHRDVGQTLVSLALCEMSGTVGQQGVGDETLSLLRRAIAIFEGANGKDDPEVGTALEAMALALEMNKLYDQAEDALTREVGILEAKFGPESGRLAKPLEKLGRVHAEQAVNGPSPAEAPVDLLDQGTVATFRQRHGERAEQCLTRALAIREKTLPPGDPQLAESLASLGVLQLQRGRRADGERQLVRWLASQEDAHAPADPNRVRVLFWLARAAKDANALADAERWAAKLQDACAETAGEESKLVLRTLLWRADVALSANRFDAAERFLKQALEVEAAWRGHDDPGLTEARALTAGRYAEHADDPRGYVRWHRLKMFRRQTDPTVDDNTLGEAVQAYGRLLQLANRVVPRPTDEDLAYWKRTRVVSGSTDMRSLSNRTELYVASPFNPVDDAGLAHVERLYDLEVISLDAPEITEAGLVHLGKLPHLRSLELRGLTVTAAGLDALRALPSLHKLELVAVTSDDSTVRRLGEIKTLRELCLRAMHVTPAALSFLRRARPDLRVEFP